MGGKASYQHDDSTDAGNWGYKHGSSPPRITIFERDGRGSDKRPALYARWYVDGRRKGPYRVRAVSTVRNASGEIDMDKRPEAEQEAKRIWKAVQKGTPPSEIFSEEEDDGPHRPEGPLTLRRGFDLALDLEEGIYQAADDDDEHYKNRQRHARYACAILGEDRAWVEMVPSVVQSIWAQMAKTTTATAPTATGWRRRPSASSTASRNSWSTTATSLPRTSAAAWRDGGKGPTLEGLLDEVSDAIDDGDLETAAELKSRINELRGEE